MPASEAKTPVEFREYHVTTYATGAFVIACSPNSSRCAPGHSIVLQCILYPGAKGHNAKAR